MPVIWLNRTTKQTTELSPASMAERFPSDAPFTGANGNAESNAAWIYLPDLSAVTGNPPKYWKISGDVVSLMTPLEQQAVDTQELSDQRDSITEQFDRVDDIIRAVALVVLDEINILRTRDGLTARTVAQMRTAIRNKLGS